MMICEDLGCFETLEYKKLKANKLFVWVGEASPAVITLLNALTLSEHGLTGMRQRSRMTSAEDDSFLTKMKEEFEKIQSPGSI